MGLAPIIESAGVSVRECTGSDGLIDPSAFACGASDLQPSRVELAADEMKLLGQSVRTEMTGISADWKGLRPWYEAPEQESLLALMDSPANDARAMEEALQASSRLLETYAAELQAIQRTLADLEWRANAFRERVRNGVLVPVSESERPTLLQTAVGLLGGPEPEVRVYWRESTEAVAENDALLGEYAQIIERLTTAADEVENGIRPLLADPTLVVDTQPIPAETFDASYVEMPWGWPAKENMNVVEDIADGGRRVWEGLLAILPMAGFDPATGQLGPAVAARSWAGAGNVLGSLVLALAYPESEMEQLGLAQVPWWQDRYRTAEAAGLMFGYDATAAGYGESVWHQWRDNPWATGIETGFNALSFLAPSAGAARFAAMSARVGRLARLGGFVADFMAPGGSYAVAGATHLGGHLADLARFGGRLDGLSIRPAGVVNAAADAFGPTPVSDELFGTTTAERPLGTTSPDDVAESGATQDPTASHTSGTSTSGTTGSSGAGGTASNGAGGASGGSGASGGGGASGSGSTGGGGGAGGSGGGSTAGGTGGGGGNPHYLSQAEVEAYQALPPMDLDTTRGPTYPSADVHHPGLHPTETPAQTYTHGQSTTGWRPLGSAGSADSIAYQTQITGVDRLPNGMRPEYTVVDHRGELVDYDGHVYRGEPPEEIFLEAKFGYHEFSTDPNGPWASMRRLKVIDQAKEQLAALPPGARLEWHVSDPRGAAALQKLLTDAGHFRIDVIYTPVI